MSNGRGGIFRYLAGCVLIFIGVIFLLQRLGIIDELTWSFWPVVLILIGIYIIFRRR